MLGGDEIMSLLEKRLKQQQAKQRGYEEKPMSGGVLSSSAVPTVDASDNSLSEFKEKVRERLLATIDPKILFEKNNPEVSAQIRETITNIINREQFNFTRISKQSFINEMVNDIVGFGPIQPLIDDETVSEIMVNRWDQVWVERNGKLYLTDIKFQNDRHVRDIVERIVQPLGRRIDESSPMVDARLPDGSRVNAAIPPVAIDGTCITIRKFKKALTIDDLVRFGSITEREVEFLKGCVVGRLNIIISGGTGSGKTSLLNCVSSFIPPDERIITIEDAAELQLQQPHVVRMETKAANVEGKGAVTIRQLVINSLRMRPDRIVVGECRGGEALDMLQAMNTGHEGSLTTIHANSPRDALTRLENLVLMAGQELPHKVVREMIARAIDIIVQTERLHDGSRRVTQITEVIGMGTGKFADQIFIQDIFVFKHEGFDENGRILGRLVSTGKKPRFLERLKHRGVTFPDDLFQAPEEPVQEGEESIA
jgi:pilus assembly protein CpaF